MFNDNSLKNADLTIELKLFLLSVGQTDSHAVILNTVKNLQAKEHKTLYSTPYKNNQQ